MGIDGKQQFQNTKDHVIGVVVIQDHNNSPKAIPVDPGDTVYLSQQEMRLTANAPKDPNENPFVNGALVQVTDDRPIPHSATDRPLAPEAPQDTPPPPAAAPSSVPPAPDETPPTSPEEAGKLAEAVVGENKPPDAPAEEETAAKTSVIVDGAEVGAAVEPQGEPEQGEYAAAEEVATPDAASKSGSKKKGA